MSAYFQATADFPLRLLNRMVEDHGIVLLTKVLLAAIVVGIGFYDIRDRRIPNLIVFPAALAGILLNCLRGWQGLWFSLAGLAAGLALLILPYLFRVMGAGDVKFLAMIGAFTGAPTVVRVLLLALATYPLLALFFVIRQKKVRLTSLRFVMLTSSILGVVIPPFREYANRLREADDASIPSATSPFGVSTAVGALLSLFTGLLA